jgi:glycosyltransferase involved in cell wall biosynthesis
MTRRICLVGPAYPFRGGIAHFTSALARTFAAHHDVFVANFKRLYPGFLFPGKTQFDESGNPFDVDSRRLIDTLNPASFWQTARAIHDFRPDCVIFQWWHPFFAPAYRTIIFFLSKLGTTNIVFLCHNVLPHESSPVDRWLIRIAFHPVKSFLVQSTEDRDNLLRLRRGARVRVQPHPIYDIFRRGARSREQARAELGVDGPMLLFFGLIRPYKGLGILIDAFAQSLEHTEARLFIVGEFYEDKAPYVERINRLGIAKRVTIVDRYVPNEDVETYFLASDVVILPYLSATQSGITQIAFAFDKPVIVTAVGGLPDVVEDGKTGFVVPPANPGALAAAIGKFYEAGDPARWEAAVRAAKGRFSWERCREALLSLADEPAPGGAGSPIIRFTATADCDNIAGRLNR